MGRKPKGRKLKKWSAEEKALAAGYEKLRRLPPGARRMALARSLDRELNRILRKEKLFRSDLDRNTLPAEEGFLKVIRCLAMEAEGFLEETESTFTAAADGRLMEEFSDLEAIGAEDWERVDGPRPSIAAGVYPKLAVSPLNALIRRYPRNFHESLARDLLASRLMDRHSHLIPALCFFEVGIIDEDTFHAVRRAAYLGSEFHRGGREFSFADYQFDLEELLTFFLKLEEHYFLHNADLKKLFKSERLKSIWPRFRAAFDTLTTKQKNALKQVKVKKRTLKSVSAGMRIRLDTLTERLDKGIRKLQRALPELCLFEPSKSYIKSRASDYWHSGLFDERRAKTPSPLYKIDPVTRQRLAVIPFPKKRKKKRVNVQAVRKWAVESTPVPDFHSTDFFLGLLPRGHLDRMSSPMTIHDRSARARSFHARLEKHRERNPYAEKENAIRLPNAEHLKLILESES